MIKHFTCVDNLTNEISFALEVDHPDDGPPRLVIPVPEGKRFVEVDEPFVRLDVPVTTLPFLIDGVVTWIETADLNGQRARKSAAISQSCADAITAGFACDALGAGYFYPAKPNDQANLTGSVVRSFYPNVDTNWRTPFWCADAEGAWEFRPHTATQIQDVGDCAVDARLVCMATNERLQAQIAGASAAQLETINWPT